MPRRPRRDVGIHGLLIAACGMLLPGCPFSDHYFVDSNYGMVGNGGTGHMGGDAGLDGGGTSIATSTGGADAGSTTLSNCNTTNCSFTCCADVCVDTASNPAHCGNCTSACTNGQACAAGSCTGGWTTMASPPSSFVARERAAYASFGDRLFIFGGADILGNSLGDAAIYDPLTNQWTTVTLDANTPSPRRLATAVWSGSSIMVFGGRIDPTSSGLLDGAMYDPAADAWSPFANSSAGRVGAVGMSNATRFAFWGGWGPGTILQSGCERFDASTNSWQSASTLGDPGSIDNPAWAIAGQTLYLFGGRLGGTTKTNQAWSYNLTTNGWSAVMSAASLSARWGAFGVWDGSAFFVWGGRDELNAKNDGQAYSFGFWQQIQQLAAPSARWAPFRQSGWTFARATGDLLFVGGQDFAGNFLKDGGRYVSGQVNGGWTPIPSWISNEDHQWGVVAYVAGSLLVWGGRTGSTLSVTGERWAP